jgi:hypothetical protein
VNKGAPFLVVRFLFGDEIPIDESTTIKIGVIKNHIKKWLSLEHQLLGENAILELFEKICLRFVLQKHQAKKMEYALESDFAQVLFNLLPILGNLISYRIFGYYIGSDIECLQNVNTAKLLATIVYYRKWLGLVPRQYSTGGKAKLFGISKRGNIYLRKVLIHGARAAAMRIKRDRFAIGGWMNALEALAPRNVMVVAMANKLARIAWAVLSTGEDYRPRLILAAA